MENIKFEISEKAKELGFFQVGFAKPFIDEKTKLNYLNWLNSGFHSEMKWLEKNIDKRFEPSLILENCKSIIVFAYSYNNNINYKKSENKISRYAWGDDYHEIILKKLKIIESEILLKYENSFSKSYVDTGAILEKYWAERAGIGWQGKNSLIINKIYGSYFFIGIILSTLEFTESEKHKNYCGKCSNCINLCPTKAIIQEEVVDSERCISYWTIESKEREFPELIIRNNKEWAFGCDICQEVCPWNKKAISNINNDFLPYKDETSFDFDFIDNIENDEFNAKYKNSPIKRRKLKGIKKNLKYLNID